METMGVSQTLRELVKICLSEYQLLTYCSVSPAAPQQQAALTDPGLRASREESPEE